MQKVFNPLIKNQTSFQLVHFFFFFFWWKGIIKICASHAQYQLTRYCVKLGHAYNWVQE